jgi:hypothetical protein
MYLQQDCTKSALLNDRLAIFSLHKEILLIRAAVWSTEQSIFNLKST